MRTLYPTRSLSPIWSISLGYGALFASGASCLPLGQATTTNGFEEGVFVGALAWLYPITDIATSANFHLSAIQQINCWFVGLSVFLGVLYGGLLFNGTCQKVLGLLVLIESMLIGSFIVSHSIVFYVALGVLAAPFLLVIFLIGSAVKGTSDGVQEFIGVETTDQKRWRLQKQEAKDWYTNRGMSAPSYLQDIERR